MPRVNYPSTAAMDAEPEGDAAIEIRALIPPTVLQRAMGWNDLTDTAFLQNDPLWRLACSDSRGTTPLDQQRPSQPTLSLSLYAYQIMHGLRCLMEQQTRTGWSISRLRDQILKVATTLTLHARRISVHLSQTAYKWWSTLLRGLPRIAALA